MADGNSIDAATQCINAFTGKTVRFSLLSESVIRMEYSSDGKFEDRNSMRVISRPEAIPFAEVSINANEVILTGKKMTIRCIEDGKPFNAGNLSVYDSMTGEKFWDPDNIDGLNFGSVHHSMDCIKPCMVPHGVHDATTDHYENAENNTWYMLHSLIEESGDESLKSKTTEELIAEADPAKYPEEVYALIRKMLKYPPGLLSRSGYFLYNDTPYETGSQDLYLFYYGRDFSQALSDYKNLFGASPLIPRYSLGLWYSRFPTFKADELKLLIREFEKNEVPLSMVVLDLEWHDRGWYGFDWNKDYFPDPKAFLDYLKEKGIHVTLNVHPDFIPLEDTRFGEFLEEAGISLSENDIEYKDDYILKKKVKLFKGHDLSIKHHADAFMNILHKPVQDQGVDFWWIDGGADLRMNHVYQNHIRENYPDRRPMIFARTPGFGAHRYPFHFTADTWSYWEVLENQVEQTLRAGHIGQSFISHDIGGHFSSFLYIDPELYVRWVQFAVLSPIVRLHSAMQEEGVGGERRPWIYGERVLHAFKEAMKLRFELIPYLYTLAWECTQTAKPMCRSNFIQDPDWEEGYDIWTSYFLGDRVYAAPFVKSGTVREVTLPPGRWYNAVTKEMLESDGLKPFFQVSSWRDMPVHYYKAGSVMIKQPHTTNASKLSDTLIVEIYPLGESCKDSFTLYEDDGISQGYGNGRFTLLEFEMQEKDDRIELTIHPIEGSFEGSLNTRNFEIKVYGSGTFELRQTGEISLREKHVFVMKAADG